MELLLEAFILFSCLMFWVVFFHKKGTLAKIKKIEASIQSKIVILEDLASKYPMHSSPVKAEVPEPKETPEESAPMFSKEKVLSKVMGSANLFEQKIENMLKNYGVKIDPEHNEEDDDGDDNETVMESSQPHSAEEGFDVLQADAQDEELERLLQKDLSFKKQAQVAIPRTKPIESFEDVINLSKALEKEQQQKQQSKA